MVSQSGPGKSFRKGLTLMDACRMFDTEEKAEAWFVSKRWPNGPICPHCQNDDIAIVTSRKPQPYRCRKCRKHFSVKTGTLMHSAKIPLVKWAIALLPVLHQPEGRQLHEVAPRPGHTSSVGVGTWRTGYVECGASRKTGSLAQWKPTKPTSVVKRPTNMPDKKLRAGRGPVGKTAVAGVKDRETGLVDAGVVQSTDGPTLRAFVHWRTLPTAMVYTDEAAAYQRLNRPHEAVSHGAGEYVRDMAHTNGMESFWSVLKRGLDGVYHHVSVKHLDRYVSEFEGRHNARPLDTADQMAALVQGADGKRMTYNDLVAPAPTGLLRLTPKIR